jgi:hypothetical protein
MPGSFQDCLQRSDMLREMDSAPRRSSRVPVPTCRFDGFVSTRNLWLGFAELLAAAYVGRDPASYTEAMRSVTFRIGLVITRLPRMYVSLLSFVSG